MPTISFSMRDLSNLIKKKLDKEKLLELLEDAKAEIESIEGDEVTIKLNDTNLPYLCSVEGLARFFRGVLGKQNGIPKIKVKPSNYKILVDNSLKNIRPYLTAFIAKGKKIDDHFLKQLIQLQEKISENYGRRRKKVSIGLYPSQKIKFPVYYKSVFPYAVKFIPLEFRKELTLSRILQEHPKGEEYAWILKDCKKYPLLIDSKKDVLSFPPIINSATTGRLEVGDDELMFEATGDDLDALNLATNIFAYALYERGFEIHSVAVKFKNKTIKTPTLKTSSIKIKKEQITNLLGLDIKDSEVKKLVEKAGYEFKKYTI